MIDYANLTLANALFGGTLIGIAAVLLILGIGRVAGVSGILASAFHRKNISKGFSWELAFVLGLVSSGWLWLLFQDFPSVSITENSATLMMAGVLVGFGTRLGSGCTSGHGVCGLSRLSIRSLAATLCFIFAGVVTVYIVRHVLG